MSRITATAKLFTICFIVFEPLMSGAVFLVIRKRFPSTVREKATFFSGTLFRHEMHICKYRTDSVAMHLDLDTDIGIM